MIMQMVDNILQEGSEVGYSSAEECGDLSGDENKQPIFVIKRGNDAEETKDDGQSAAM